MSRAIWKLTVRTEFCAAHALRHYQGKCERLHGHNYGVELTVQGSTLHQDTELLMDFSDLKQALRQVLDPLDHHYLNEVPPFDRINPSAENLSRYLWCKLRERLPQEVTLSAVTVSEKGIQSATYMEIDD